MTERERKTAYAWDHIKQAGAAFAKRGDTLLPGYRELKRMGVVTIDGSHVRLTGDYRRAFQAGEDLPSWADLSIAVPTVRHHATKKTAPAQLQREIDEVLAQSRAAQLAQLDAETADPLPREVGLRWVSGRSALVLEAQGRARRTGRVDDQGRVLVQFV